MRLFLLSLLLSTSLLSLTPTPTEAALIPCGRNTDDPATSINEQAPCTLCHLIIGIKGIIDWMRTIMTAIAITVIVAMGILYIISTGNDQMMQTAKHGLTASLIGLAIILGAWLIVNFTLTLPIIKVDGLVKKNWNTVSCDIASSAGTPIASTSGIVNTTPTTQAPGETALPLTTLNPSTGVALTLSKASFYPKEAITLSLAQVDFANGPVSFRITTTDPKVTSTNGITIAETTTNSASLLSLTNTQPGLYALTPYQNNQPIAPPLSFTVLTPPYPGGTDTGGSNPSNPGGNGEGGACIGTSPEGIPYNNKLPLAPMTGWTGQQQYDYWITIPAQVDLQDPNNWGYNGYSEPIKYAMWKYGNNEFRALVRQKTFGGSLSQENQWINGNDQWLKADMGFDMNTGIGTYQTLTGVQTKVYPASGIPPRAGCVTSGGGSIPFSGTCPGYSTTYHLKQPWRADGANSQTHLNSLENGAALVVSFTTPATLNPRGGWISSFESTGAQACKSVVLSKTPCDFAGPGLTQTQGSTAPLYFSGGGSTASGYPVLQPNTTYYYNVLHRCYSPPSGRDMDTCTGVCDVKVELSQP